MFTFDPDGSYVMPAHFGPRPLHPKSSGWYRDVTAMVITYVTDRDLLARHLPAPFAVGEDPIVTVFYACNRQVDWLAGHGYNMIAVSASAVFDGEQDQLTGPVHPGDVGEPHRPDPVRAASCRASPRSTPTSPTTA